MEKCGQLPKKSKLLTKVGEGSLRTVTDDSRPSANCGGEVHLSEVSEVERRVARMPRVRSEESLWDGGTTPYLPMCSQGSREDAWYRRARKIQKE